MPIKKWDELLEKKMSKAYKDKVLAMARKKLIDHRTDRLSWMDRWQFVGLSALGIVAAVSGFWVLQKTEDPRPEPSALLGSIDFDLMQEDLDLMDDLELIELLDELEGEDS